MSEVVITSADSRIRVVDGVDLVHKFKGFRNTNRQISASLTANGNYVVCASEDSQVYVWKHEADSRRPTSRHKGVTLTHSYEHFQSQDVSVAIAWPGFSQQEEEANMIIGGDHLDVNHPPTPVDEASANAKDTLGIISSASNGYFFDRFSATWPEEKLILATRKQGVDFTNGVGPSKSGAWGMVIVTAGLHGEITTFQNFGLPVRI